MTASSSPSDKVPSVPPENDPVMFETSDYQKRKVVLREQTWHNHILFDIKSGEPGHPELEDHVDDIRGIVEDPEVAAKDPDYESREQLFGLASSVTLDRIKTMRVVVDYEPSPARVVTAQFMNRIKLTNTGGVIYERRKRIEP